MMPTIEAVVFDVLGTLVDQPGGIRADVRAAAPPLDDAEVGASTERWLEQVGREQQRILDGTRPYADSVALDHEAASAAGVTGVAGAYAGVRVPAWPDAATGLARLAARYPIIALSNAAPPALLRLAAHAGLRWHLTLSAAAARTYKPDPRVYELALDAAGVPASRMLMVATHAWDLRGARAVGMRTAYVARPVGDPPAPGERFDVHAVGMDDLAEQLGC